MAMSVAGGGELEPDLGKLGGKKRYRGVPSKDERPGVEDLEA